MSRMKTDENEDAPFATAESRSIRRNKSPACSGILRVFIVGKANSYGMAARPSG